jgi:hypothetical protein
VWVCGVFLLGLLWPPFYTPYVIRGASLFSLFNKTSYYLSKKKKKELDSIGFDY